MGDTRSDAEQEPELVLTQRELRNQSGAIMRGLERGQRYLITSNGMPVGELTPRHRRHFTPRARVAEAFAGAPALDLSRLRADLDALAGQDATPRTASGK
jgi:antitoxin (DNA-binding transcriptional repressor) of toxin-antitoxin stability system